MKQFFLNFFFIKLIFNKDDIKDSLSWVYFLIKSHYLLFKSQKVEFMRKGEEMAVKSVFY